MTPGPAGFTGTFLYPHDDGYHEARRVWNAMHDRHPTGIARCRGVEEVAIAVQHAASLGLPVTIRGGGHNVAGAAIADGALMIDLSPMRGVTVNVGARWADADGGCLLGDVDRATAPHGLACPSGVVSHTGLGGLALGGGYGWLARKWGLTCDHIRSAQVVLADGEIVEASPARHADLFWAVRGEAGGFGVVTRFSLRLRPVAPMYYRSVMFGLESAEAALAAYRRFAPGQPDDLHVIGCRRSRAAKKRGTARAARHSRGRPHRPLHRRPGRGPGLRRGPLRTAGRRGVHRARHLIRRSAGAWRHQRAARPPLLHQVKLPRRPVARYRRRAARLGGGPAVAAGLDRLRVPARGYQRAQRGRLRLPRRGAPYICTFSAHWTDPDGDAAQIRWARESLARTRADRYGGAYQNYLQDEPEDAVLVTNGADRHRRLADVRSRYDPEGVFHRGADDPSRRRS